MTISAYTGLPGHGKSYGVVENVIAKALETGRTIFTNIPMVESECLDRYKSTVIQFKTEDIIENESWWDEVFISGAIIVIDELWRLWPAGLNAKNVRDKDKAFLAEHRHLVGDCGNSTEIIFVTQDLSQVASFARNLVETTFRVTKLSKVGFSNSFRIDIYFGPVTGVTPPKSKKDKEIYGKFKEDTYKLYQSHTKSNSGTSGNEKRIDDRFNLLKGKLLPISATFLILLIYVVYSGFKNVSSYYGSEPTTNKSTQISQLKPKIKPIVKPIFKFLSKADYISIIYNNGHWPDIEYLYRVEIENNITDLTYSDFQNLGYNITPINKCMVKIQGPDFDSFVLCKKDSEPSNWLEQTIPNTNLAAK